MTEIVEVSTIEVVEVGVVSGDLSIAVPNSFRVVRVRLLRSE